ncbi:unnamed protein product [Thelazia callipaeda]|uniref:Retrotransposon protein n=1 Tax=Thelazia callipaeda TaxID=103827 RepID=A0A0N5CQ24_THECL|nr:unnamed protein product [Thelazia callipaeda]
MAEIKRKTVAKRDGNRKEEGCVVAQSVYQKSEKKVVPQSSWSGEVLKAVLDRFERMPKGGWPLYRSLYCERFVCIIGLEELKKKANAAIISIA